MTPSIAPSITGAVAFVSLSGATTIDISDSEANAIASEIAEVYGFEISVVEFTTDYVTSGTLEATIPDGISHEIAVELLQNSIGDVLGVHPSDIVTS